MIGSGPADQAAADIRIAARSGVETELADHLEPRDARDGGADLEVFRAGETEIRSRTPMYSPVAIRSWVLSRCGWSSAPGPASGRRRRFGSRSGSRFRCPGAAGSGRSRALGRRRLCPGRGGKNRGERPGREIGGGSMALTYFTVPVRSRMARESTVRPSSGRPGPAGSSPPVGGGVRDQRNKPRLRR